MDQLKPAAMTGARRRTLAEEIDLVDDYDEEAFEKFIDDTERDDRFAQAYRRQSKSLQERQDLHLKLYRAFVRVLSRLPDDTSDADTDRLAFPENHKKLYVLVRKFMMFAYKRASPRNIFDDDHIKLSTLAKYRSSILYWSNKTYAAREVDPPIRARLFNEMTQGMHAAQAKYGKRKRRGPSHKTSVGLPELRFLLDYEQSTAYCIENSEQHALTWCLGRLTAIRPGSIGPGKGRESTYLCWNDIEIQRGKEAGMFDLRVDFDKLKNRTETDEADDAVERLELYIRSPDARNIIFSPAHRLLVIALRRNLIQGVATLEELLDGNLQFITIKSKHLQDPVFYASGPRGMTIEPPKPLTASGISSYLHLRGQAVGFTKGISFYSLRRRSATDLVPVIGAERTRIIMGHAPDTRTLERYYLNLMPTLDLTGMALGEPLAKGGISAEMQEKASTLAIYKLDAQSLAQVRGAAINALVRKMMAADPEWLEKGDAMTDSDVKNYTRRMRYRAAEALRRQEAARLREQMTVEDYSQRVLATRCSDFAKAVHKEAIRITQLAVTEDEIQRAEALEQHDMTEEYDEGKINDIPEKDLEAELSDENGVRRIDLSNAFGDEDDLATDQATLQQFAAEAAALGINLTYKNQALAFMKAILGNTQSTAGPLWDEQDQTCKLCAADDTMSEAAKTKQWRTAADLQIHMEGAVHSPCSQWARRNKQNHASEHGGDKMATWDCQYCVEALEADIEAEPEAEKRRKLKSFVNQKLLMRHIRDSTVSRDGQVHEDGKERDGWFRNDWNAMPSEDVIKGRSRRVTERLKDAGFEFIDDHAEMPFPRDHPSLYGVRVGEGDLHESLRDSFTGVVDTQAPAADEALLAEGIPAHLQGMVRAANPVREANSKIPDHFAGVLEYGELPAKRKPDGADVTRMDLLDGQKKTKRE